MKKTKTKKTNFKCFVSITNRETGEKRLVCNVVCVGDGVNITRYLNSSLLPGSQLFYTLTIIE